MHYKWLHEAWRGAKGSFSYAQLSAILGRDLLKEKKLRPLLKRLSNAFQSFDYNLKKAKELADSLAEKKSSSGARKESLEISIRAATIAHKEIFELLKEIESIEKEGYF